MKTKILLVMLPLLAAMTANASALETDLAAVNGAFGTHIQKQDLGKILDHCGAGVEREFDIGTEGEPHSVFLNPLTYLAHKAGVDTLWAVLKAFEEGMAKHDQVTKRDVRFRFYDTLVRALVQGSRFLTVSNLISRDKSRSKIFAVTITRRLVLALLEEENSSVLTRFHNPSIEPNKNEKKSLGSKYPDLYLCQPTMANLVNDPNMRLFVIRDLIEGIIKNRGSPDEQRAKDALKFFISYYSNRKALPVERVIWAGPYAFDVNKNLVEETQQKFSEHFQYVMDVLKALRAELIAEKVVIRQNIPEVPEPPREQTGLRKSVSFGSPPLQRHKRPDGNSTPSKSILKKRDSASDSSSRDLLAANDAAQKKAKAAVSEVRTCSDIAFLILENHADEFIIEAMTECENAGFCSINSTRIPTLAFLLEKGRFALLQKLAASVPNLSLNELWNDQLTVRGLIFDVLLKQRSIADIAAFLRDPNLHGDEKAKASLLLSLAKAYLAKALTQEEFERIVMTQGVFANAACLEEIEGSADVATGLLEKNGSNHGLLRSFLSMPWFASQATASLLAHQELMKAAKAGDLEKFAFWTNSGLIDLNGKEYDFAE